MEATKENKMGTAPVFNLILKMSLPAMFSMLIQSLYNVVDAMFVSKINDNAFNALNLAFPVQTLMIAVAVGTGVGINSLVSRKLGEGKREEASNAASHGLVLGAINWLVFVILGVFFTKGFYQLFTNDSEVLRLACDYTYIVTILSFGVFIEVVLEKTLQATGNMIFPMLFQLTGAVTNIILDPIFIFVFKMGIKGAAIATVIGQILAMIFSLIIIFTKNHEVHITLRKFRFNRKIVKEIYVVGLPSIVMQSIMSVLVAGLNKILALANSNDAINVLGSYYKLQSFVFMPVFGLNQGVMPIMGYNYGAGNKKRLLSALKYGLAIAVAIMALGTIIFCAIPGLLLSIFNASSSMLEIGVPALRIISICFVFAALGIIFSTLFQAVGNGVYSLIVSVLRQLVIILPVAYFLSLIGLEYFWYAFPIAEVVSFVISILLFKRLYSKKIKNLEQISI